MPTLGTLILSTLDALADVSYEKLFLVIVIPLILVSALPIHAQAAQPNQGWAYTKNDLPSPRHEHGIAMLEDGRILVVGGLDPSPSRQSSIFDTSTNAWSSTGKLNTPRFWFGNLVSLRTGSVLIAGGTDVTGYNDFDTSELYNPATGVWKTTGAKMHTARRNASLTVLPDGRVLMAGGRHGPPDGSSFLDSSEIYDPLADTWTLTAGHLSVAREGHLAVLLNDGRVLVAGGEGPWFVAGKTAELFDPSTGAWSLTGSMTDGWLARSATLTLLRDGRVLRTGGTDGQGNYFSTAEIYNPGTGIWTVVHSMKIARANHTATLLPDGRVLVVGGENNAGTTATGEIYNPVTDKWTAAADLQGRQGRAGQRTILLSTGKVLIVGGWSGTVNHLLASSELYHNTSYRPAKTSPIKPPYQKWHTMIIAKCAYARLTCTVKGSYHTGIDSTGLANKRNEPISTTVTAMADGILVMARPNSNTADGFGNTVILQHLLVNGTKLYSLYAHMQNLDAHLPPLGSCLPHGSRLGIIGLSDTGLTQAVPEDRRTPAVYLHVEFKEYPVVGDPRSALGNPGSQGQFFGYITPGDAAHQPNLWGYRDPGGFVGKEKAFDICR